MVQYSCGYAQEVLPLCTDARVHKCEPTPYVLVAAMLTELRAKLPRGLVHSDRQPGDPPDLAEIWFANTATCGHAMPVHQVMCDNNAA